MKNLSMFNRYRKPYYDDMGDDKNGFFFIPRVKGYFQVVASNGLGWEHVSFCLFDEKGKLEKRIPKYSEVCKVKEMFFGTEAVYEIHPKEEDYINEHPYVLHLWKPTNKEMPLPNIEEIKEEQLIKEEIINRKNLKHRLKMPVFFMINPLFYVNCISPVFLAIMASSSFKQT